MQTHRRQAGSTLSTGRDAHTIGGTHFRYTPPHLLAPHPIPYRMKPLRSSRLVSAFALTCLLAPALKAADTPATPPPATAPTADKAAASERTAKAKLLGVRRVPIRQAEGGPVDGLSFAVLVAPTGEAGGRTMKEPRDFLVGGESYHARTENALGKKFEPRTEIHDADTFLEKTPVLKPDNFEVPKGSFVMTISILGAALEPGAEVRLPLTVGFLKKPTQVTLITKVPPSR